MNTGFCCDHFCEASEVKIPVDSIGLNRGYAAFDFLKVVHGKAFFPERHLDRFFRTMDLLRISISQSRDQVLEIITHLAGTGKESCFGLKLFAVPLDSEDPECYPANLYIHPVSLTLHPDSFYSKGSKLITFEYSRFLPNAKSTNYLPSMLWESEVKRRGAIEPLFHFGGYVLETARSNVFMCKEGQLITPTEGVLHGITRSVIIDLARNLDIPLVERDVRLVELFNADEVFVTSTTKGVGPIVNVDGTAINDGRVGPVTTQLVNDYRALLNVGH